MSPKRLVIIQSCYIPWKGYFDLIASADEFIFYDDVQYTKNDWRNRNIIKTSQGPQWLTVPVLMRGNFGQTIREAKIENTPWAKKHWRTICVNYSKAPYFKEVSQFLEPFYTEKHYDHISVLNQELTIAICNYLGIKTKISDVSDYNLIDGKTERLIDLCKQSGAGVYISGPSAKDYIDRDQFKEAGIALEWFDYSGYPEYPQLWGDFVHAVSVLDLLFNCGQNAGKFMKYVRA